MIKIKIVNNFWSYKSKQYTCYFCNSPCKDIRVYYKEITKDNAVQSKSITTVCIACSLSKTNDEIERTI